jgi:hypothetical protein
MAAACPATILAGDEEINSSILFSVAISLLLGEVEPLFILAK